MNIADMPPLVPIPFANNAGDSYIRQVPVASQIGVQAGAASFTDGFTPDTFTPLSGGGAYVDGEDVNGILNHITKWTRWLGAGGPAVYNATFATAIGGYPKGATLVSATLGGRLWMSTVDGNLTDPDGASAAGWVAVGPVAATLAQAEAGADTSTFLTPAVLAALLASDNVLATNGHIRLGAATLQWGRDPRQTNASGQTFTTSFNVPFSGAPWAVLFTPGLLNNSNNGYNQKKASLAGSAAAGFQWKVWDDDSADANSYINGLNWLAIGPT